MLLKTVFYKLIEKIYLGYDNNLVYYDQLTSLHNRNYYERVLKSKVPSMRSFSVVIIDIDNFKSINDTYGHDMGDQFLCIVAQTIKHIDHVLEIVRLGGDEFLMLVDNDFNYSRLDDLCDILSYGKYYKESNDSFSKAMELADLDMYHNKHNKRKSIIRHSNTNTQSTSQVNAN